MQVLKIQYFLLMTQSSVSHSWAQRKLIPLSPLNPLNILLTINGPLLSLGFND